MIASVGVPPSGEAISIRSRSVRKLRGETIRGDLSLDTKFSSEFVGPMTDERIETSGHPESYPMGRVARAKTGTLNRRKLTHRVVLQSVAV